MASGRRILIAGIGTHWGTELALRLERDPRVEQVLGIDTTPPLAQLERTEFLEADIRSPLLAPPAARDRGRHARPRRDPLVSGARQAAAGAPRHQRDRHPAAARRLRADRRRSSASSCAARRRSTAASRPAPSFFTESMAADFPLRTRFQRDIGELEGYFENFARRHSRLTCCMLRYQPEIGPGLDAPIARYLSLPVVPTQLGFDPRLQLLHADDATGGAPCRGDEPDPRRRQRRPERVDLAVAGAAADRPRRRCRSRTRCSRRRWRRLGDRLGAGSLYGDAVRLLRYGRGVDNSRLRNELGFEPALRRGRRDPRLRRRRSRPPARLDAGRRLRPRPPRGDRRDERRGGPGRHRSRRSACASCAASAPPSTAASTR